MNLRECKLNFVWPAVLTAVFAGKLIFAFDAHGPDCFLDELLYVQNARSLFENWGYRTPHYPPLYPMAVSFSFWFDNWYRAIILMNVALSSCVVPAAWFLARAAKVERPELPATLCALLPFHVVYPHYVLSENLFVPLFVLALALAVDEARTPCRDAVFGAVLALAHLTRYLFLPAIPVLLILYLLPDFRSRRDWRFLFHADSFKRLTRIGFAYSLPVGVWALFGARHGFEFGHLFGFGVPSVFNKPSGFDAGKLLLWTGVYLAYAVLAWASIWACVAVLGRGLWKWFKDDAKGSERKLLAGASCLTAGYLMLAIQHSFFAAYNDPNPQYIIGRYLMHVTPVLLACLVVLLSIINRQAPLISRRRILCGAIAVVSGCGLARAILFHDVIFDLPGWFAAIQFNAIDVFVFRDHPVFLVYILSIILMVVSAKFLCRNSCFAILPVFVAMTVSCIPAYQVMKKRDMPIHMREVASAMQNHDKEFKDKRCSFFIDYKWLSPETFANGLKFWGLADDVHMDVHRGLEKLDASNCTQDSPCLILTANPFNEACLTSYRAHGKEFKVYWINNGKPFLSHAPRILNYGPRRLRAGRPFNVQPSGLSAVWLKVACPSNNMAVLWNHNQLAATVGVGGAVSAVVPSELFQAPGSVELRLVNTATGERGDPVIIEIASGE